METLSPLIIEQIAAVLDRKRAEAGPEHLYNTVEAAKYLNCSTVQVWKLRRAGRLAFLKTGGSPRYTRKALDSILNEKGAAA
jgi:excisionase family DNA binding protein